MRRKTKGFIVGRVPSHGARDDRMPHNDIMRRVRSCDLQVMTRPTTKQQEQEIIK